MARHLFHRFGNDLPRPDDASLNHKQVFNLHDSELDLKVRSKLLENDHVSLMQVTGIPISFEIILTVKPTVYSIFRHKGRAEAEAVHNRMAHVFNPLISTSSLPRTEMRETADFIQAALDIALSQPDWSVAHIAARLAIAAPFRQKSPLFIQHINEVTANKRRTVLRNAVLSGNDETVAAVLDCNPDVDVRDIRGSNALFQAAALPNHNIFVMILKKYQSKYKNSVDFLRVKDDRGLTALHVACYAEQYGNIVELLSLGLPMDILILNRPKSVIFRNPQLQTPGTSKGQQIENEEKRQRSTIVQFTKEMKEDIDWDEVKLGGCPIFWMTNTIYLNKMLELNFPQNIVNFCFETAVHVMARRKILSNLLILLSNGFPQLATLAARNTPLHQAIKSCDMSSVQALTAFDANVNAPNSRGENPRHLTHSLPKEGTGNGGQILYILCSLGAKRCSIRRPDCYEGCEPGGKFDGYKDQNWPDFRSPTLYTKSLMGEIVQAALAGNVGTCNILSCDGGGTKGLITCQILVELQRNLKHPIHEYFEWISGTSTGSFIAACLSLGMDVRTIRKHYLMLKDEIISGEKPYPSEPIERFCKFLLGPDRVMSDVKNHKLIITGCLGDRFPPQLYLFRSYVRWEDDKSETRSMLYDFVDPDPNHRDWRRQIEHIWFACRASAAAPTYFAPIGPFIDGGVISANPTLDTISEFIKHQSKKSAEMRQSLGVVVSLGTGKWPIVEHPLANVGRLNWSNPLDVSRQLQQVLALATMVGGAATNTDSWVVDRGQTTCFMGKVPFFRISPPLSFQLELNVTADVDLVNAMYETKAYFYALANELPVLVRLLEMARMKTLSKVQQRMNKG